MLIYGFRKFSAIAAVSALSVAILGCSDSPQEAQGQSAPAPTVSVIAVDTQPFTASLDFVGKTEAFSLVNLRARVTGFLSERLFAEGTNVKKGDRLYQIDTAEFDAAVAAASAGLERAQAAFTEADQTYSRSKTLADRGTISEASLDEAVAALGTTKADVAAAEADLAAAKLNLSYTTIISPLDGRIGSSAVNAGNLIGPDSGVLATVVALDPMRVVFSISEQIYIDLQKDRLEGREGEVIPRIRLANNEIYEHPGEFRFVDNQVDPSTGTVSVHVDFPNPDQFLLPGQFVNVILSAKEADPAILIPQAAVQLNQAGPFVLLVDKDSKVEVRPIKTGERSGIDIVVEDGLTVGETVIVSGIQKVRPGAEVTAQQVAAQTAPQ